LQPLCHPCSCSARCSSNRCSQCRQLPLVVRQYTTWKVYQRLWSRLRRSKNKIMKVINLLSSSLARKWRKIRRLHLPSGLLPS
jgi:hypothetical protein